MEFEISLLRYTSVGDEMWLLGWHIPTSVYETSQATAPWIDLVFLSCCIKNKRVEKRRAPSCSTDVPEVLLGTNTHIVNDNNAKSKAPMHSSVYILDTGLCRFLNGNNLSVLPFNIFQELNSLQLL